MKGVGEELLSQLSPSERRLLKSTLKRDLNRSIPVSETNSVLLYVVVLVLVLGFLVSPALKEGWSPPPLVIVFVFLLWSVVSIVRQHRMSRLIARLCEIAEARSRSVGQSATTNAEADVERA